MAFNDIHIDEPTDDELCEVFIEETESIVVELADLADRCRHDLGNAVLLKDIRRQFHTLKGSGRMVGLDAIGEAAWKVEDMLNRWLSSELPGTPRLCDFVESCAPVFGAWAAELKEHGKVTVDAKNIGFEVEVFLDYLKNPAAANVSDPAAPAEAAKEEEEHGQSAEEYVALAAGDMSDFDALMGLSEDASQQGAIAIDGINHEAAVEMAIAEPAETDGTSERYSVEIEADAQAPAQEESDAECFEAAPSEDSVTVEIGEPETQGQDEANAVADIRSENEEEIAAASEISGAAPFGNDDGDSFEHGESNAVDSGSETGIEAYPEQADIGAESILEKTELQDEIGSADIEEIDPRSDMDRSIASEKAFEDERDELAKFMIEAVPVEAVSLEAEPADETGVAAGPEASQEEEAEDRISATEPDYDNALALEDGDEAISDAIQAADSAHLDRGSARLEGFSELLEEEAFGVERVQAQWEDEADSIKAKHAKPIKESRDYAPLVYSGLIAAILAAGIYGFFFM